MGDLVWFILLLGVWTFFIVFFRNLKMDFFKFLVGSLGLFTILIIFFREPLEGVLIDGLTNVLEYISGSINGFDIIKNNGMLMIEGAGGGVITIAITYECSGVIEMFVFSCLVVFFPFIRNYKKVVYLILGNVYLFIANILRILLIVGSVRIFGVESYGIAHLIIARGLFFILTILIYYHIFTKSQLKNQQVGDIT